MAFPGTYNIDYYKGDTFEFRVYPKDSAGAAFPLEDYATGGTTTFTIAPSRGELDDPLDAIEGYAVISDDYTYVQCAITPANGAELVAGTPYVYDVEITRTDAPYDFTFTLLTGTISITDQVTQPDAGGS